MPELAGSEFNRAARSVTVASPPLEVMGPMKHAAPQYEMVILNSDRPNSIMKSLTEIYPSGCEADRDPKIPQNTPKISDAC